MSIVIMIAVNGIMMFSSSSIEPSRSPFPFRCLTMEQNVPDVLVDRNVHTCLL
jgi:hypothetical protein